MVQVIKGQLSVKELNIDHETKYVGIAYVVLILGTAVMKPGIGLSSLVAISFTQFFHWVALFVVN